MPEAAYLKDMGESPSSIAFLQAHPELIPDVRQGKKKNPVSQRDEE